MDLNRILAELKAERARLDAAISAIEGVNSRGTRRGRRRLSAAARTRISEAQKARWANREKRAKGSNTEAPKIIHVLGSRFAQ